MDDKEKYGENYLGHVIRIISDKKLIVDVGDDYLTIGDDVIIYTVSEDDILDLDGNSLGVFEYNKAILKVVSTTSQYSVCETPKTTEKTSSIAAYSNLFTTETIKQESLNILEKDIESIEIENKDVIVKGDLVKKC